MTGQKDRYTTTEKLWKLDDSTLTTPKHDEMVLDLLDIDYIRWLIPELDEFLADEKIRAFVKSEVPLHQRNGFLAGYLDIRVSADLPYGTDHYETPWGVLVPEFWTPEGCRVRSSVCICIEVKPEVRSFGETLRQINTYKELVREYDLPRPFYLYTCTTRFDAAFESQGIKVLHPTPRP